MRAADAAAAAAGISVARLMESAGTEVAESLLDLFPDTLAVLVLCGKGNNGGDGYVAARHLLEHGLAVEVWESSEAPATAEAAQARAALVGAGGRPVPLESASLGRRLAGAPVPATVIIDALLGCGLDRPLTGAVADVVEAINSSEVPVLAVDVPTGVAADSPLLTGPHIKADATVQLAGAKLASAFYPAKAAFARGPGRDVGASVVDIGIPADILEGLSSLTLVTEAWCAQWLPRRSPTSHKYSVGTVTVVAGSSSYSGAAELACRGAWRGGAGLVTLVSDHRHPAAWPETVYLTPGTAATWPPAGLTFKAAGSCIVGPGLTHNAADLLSAVLGWAPGPVVVDAGALAPDVLWPTLEVHRSTQAANHEPASTDTRAYPLILTPHAGEAARLLEIDSAAVGADPVAAATQLSRRSGAVVVLKGPTTVVVAPDGEAAVSTRGHPGMASGGTGDVLAGLLGAVTASLATEHQGEVGHDTVELDHQALATTALFRRACLAVYVHGVAGERAAARYGNSLLASDLVDELGGVLTGLATVGC